MLQANLQVQSNPFNAVLKLYAAEECGDPDPAQVYCEDSSPDGGNETLVRALATTGWHTLVVDGAWSSRIEDAGEEDHGLYGIRVSLSNGTNTCSCP